MPEEYHSQKTAEQTGMTPKRLESLADAIFAFAMTLLVLSINLPQDGSLENIGSFLNSQYQNFENFVLSFLLLAFIWLEFSQQFHHIRRTDSPMIFMSIFILMFVVLVPFSTSLMNDYSNSVTAEVFFNGNLFLLIGLMCMNWLYVERRGMLNRDRSDPHIRYASIGSLVLPLIPLAGIGLAFVTPGRSTYVYLLIPAWAVAATVMRKQS